MTSYFLGRHELKDRCDQLYLAWTLLHESGHLFLDRLGKECGYRPNTPKGISHPTIVESQHKGGESGERIEYFVAGGKIRYKPSVPAVSSLPPFKM